MVILAHPDDPEFLCGGTVARWVQEGREVIYALVTHGERGSDDPTIPTEELARIREAEQQAAARVLGVQEVVFLNYPDGSVTPNLKLRRDLARLIRRFRPDIVITSDPTLRYRSHYLNHPDHRAVGDAALDAVFPDARNPRQFPELLQEGLTPHHVHTVYLAGTDQPDTEVDITATLQQKLEALRQHRSQIKDFERLEEWLKERHRVEGENGSPHYVERFRQITLR